MISTCVILPTRNEEANIATVLRRLDALDTCDEIIVVDDSDDNTAAVALHLEPALTAKLIVHHRSTSAEREGGLGTAILAGIGLSSAARFAVMDADLQHPPELVPELLAKLDSVELAIASRFNWDSVIAGLSPIRRLASRAAGSLAFAILPGQLDDVSDPMSGFFACRRESLTIDRLQPNGYKILLEILGTHPELSRAEIPFSFGHRAGGESKADFAEGVRYLKHVTNLRRRSRGFAAGGEVADPIAVSPVTSPATELA